MERLKFHSFKDYFTTSLFRIRKLYSFADKFLGAGWYPSAIPTVQTRVGQSGFLRDKKRRESGEVRTEGGREGMNMSHLKHVWIVGIADKYRHKIFSCSSMGVIYFKQNVTQLTLKCAFYSQVDLRARAIQSFSTVNDRYCAFFSGFPPHDNARLLF